MLELVAEFKAQNEDGDVIVILEYRGIKDVLTVPGDENKNIYGLPQFKTTSGELIKPLEEGFQIEGQDKIYYKIEG